MGKTFKHDTNLRYVAMSSPAEAELSLEYSDEDLVLIDNVKLLVVPDFTKLQMNIIAFCTKGKIQGEINGIPFIFGANQMLVCPTNVSFANFMMTPDFEFNALFVSNRMLQNILRARMNSWTNLLLVRKQHVTSLGEDEIIFLVRFYELLKVFCNHPENQYKSEAVESLLRGGFIALMGFLMDKVEGGEHNAMVSGRRNSEMLFQQFLDLLGNITVKHHTVEYYARELCVTPKNLSLVCKIHSGKTANEWIREFVLEDIRYYLLQTNLSNKQICAQMGFPNTSFFGRYVKEHFGKPPSQFRKGYGIKASESQE